MTGNLPVFAAAVATLLVSTSACFGSDAMGELQACRSLGDAERLACFDRVLARQDTAPAASAAKQPADFGSERLARPDGAAVEAEFIVATVANVGWSAIKHFTITLDNGQVWRQIEADTAIARFTGGESVKITRGFFNSYSLTVNGVWGTYKVKRIK